MDSNDISSNIDLTGIYTQILSIVYPTFLCTTVIAHGVLLVFIVFFSPLHLKVLRLLLLKTSILDVLATVTNFYIQPRIVSGGKVNVPVYCYGPCRYMSLPFCFSVYMGWQTISLAVGVSMTYTLFFKYYKLNFNQPLVGKRLLFSMLGFYTPCFVSVVTLVFQTFRLHMKFQFCSVIIVLRNSLPVEASKRIEEVAITEMEYSLIGRMTLGEVPNKVNFSMMAYGIYISPFLAFWFRWKSNKQLNQTITGASPYLRYHVKNVMTGVTIQVFMHFLFYIPMFSLYSYSLISGNEVLVQQFFLAMSPNLAATFDPLINLYYVIPYRNRIKSWFCSRHEVTPLRVASLTPSAVA